MGNQQGFESNTSIGQAEKHKAQGNNFYNLGSYYKAIKEYTKAIELAPCEEVYYNNRAACFLMLDLIVFALKDALKAYQLNPNYVQALIRVAKIYLKLGELDQSEKILSEFFSISFKSDPNEQEKKEKFLKEVQNLLSVLTEVRSQLRQVKEYLTNGNYAAALTLLETILSSCTHCQDFKILKAKCLIGLKKFHKLNEIATSEDIENDTSGEILYIVSLSKYYEKDLDAAKDLINQAMQRDPTNQKFVSLFKKVDSLIIKSKLAFNTFKNCSYELSYKYYSEALEVDPENHMICSLLYYNRARTQIEMKKFAEAIGDCSKAIQLDKKYLKAYFRRAECYSNLKNYDNAIADYIKVLELDSNYIQAEIELGKVLQKRTKFMNYYEILGVPIDASNTEIKKAFHKLSLQYHPDKNQNDEGNQVIIKNINEAYQVLSNATERSAFDEKLKIESTIEELKNSLVLKHNLSANPAGLSSNSQKIKNVDINNNPNSTDGELKKNVYKEPKKINKNVQKEEVKEKTTPTRFWKWFYEDDFSGNMKELGKGKFGEVKQAKFVGAFYLKMSGRPLIYANKEVALKYPFVIDKPDFIKQSNELSHEVSCTVLLHPCIINYIGGLSLGDGSQKNPRRVGIVMELMECSLVSAIEKDSRLKKRIVQIQIAKQIASAMNFLHSLRPSILHRDLRTPNILLNSNLDCKIGDFGISDNLGYTQLNHQGTYYHKLLPPECNTGGKFEKEGDVYFYGWLLVELICGRKFESYDIDQIDFYLNGAFQRDTSYSQMKQVILNCLRMKPKQRSSFCEICSALNSILDIKFDAELIGQSQKFQQEKENLNHFINQIELVGWLFKRGNNILRAWKKRLLKLKDFKLCCYIEENDESSLREKIDLIEVIQYCKNPLKKEGTFEFSIQAPNRLYYFKTDNEIKFEYWWKNLSLIFETLNPWYSHDSLRRHLVHQFCIFGNLNGLTEWVSMVGTDCLNFVDIYNTNCAHFAARSGHCEILKFLHKNGFTGFNEREKRFDIAPLTLSISMKHKECVEFLASGIVDQACLDEGLIYSCAEGNLQFVELLIEKKAQVNSCDPDLKKTSLAWATSNNHLGVVKFLLEKGADVNLGRISNSTTPLWFACENGYKDIAEELLKKGANPNIARSDDGITPLYIACQNNFSEIVELLLQYKADPNIWSKEGEYVAFYVASEKGQGSPLYIAAQHGFTNIVELLLKNGADPGGHIIASSYTPLMIASYEGHYETVKMLLKYKANRFQSATLFSITAESLAKEMGHEDIVKLLREYYD